MTEQEIEPSNEAARPRYDLKSEEMTALVERLVTERLGDIPDKYRFAAVEVGPTSEYADVGRSIERTVFEQSFGNTSEDMQREYGPFEAASTFFLSVDRERKTPTGVLRVIKNSSAGLKSLNDAQQEPFSLDSAQLSKEKGMAELDRVWDIGTIAVLPEFRRNSGPVSILLERAMYKSAVLHNVQSLVSIIDDKPLTKMRSRWRGVGIPFRQLTKPQPYLGSKKSHVVAGFIPEFYEKMSTHRESVRGRLLARYALGDALDRLVEGTEDDAIVLDSL